MLLHKSNLNYRVDILIKNIMVVNSWNILSRCHWKHGKSVKHGPIQQWTLYQTQIQCAAFFPFRYSHCHHRLSTCWEHACISTELGATSGDLELACVLLCFTADKRTRPNSGWRSIQVNTWNEMKCAEANNVFTFFYIGEWYTVYKSKAFRLTIVH